MGSKPAPTRVVFASGVAFCHHRAHDQLQRVVDHDGQQNQAQARVGAKDQGGHRRAGSQGFFAGAEHGGNFIAGAELQGTGSAGGHPQDDGEQDGTADHGADNHRGALLLPHARDHRVAERCVNQQQNHHFVADVGVALVAGEKTSEQRAYQLAKDQGQQEHGAQVEQG